MAFPDWLYRCTACELCANSELHDEGDECPEPRCRGHIVLVDPFPTLINELVKLREVVEGIQSRLDS